MKKILRLDVLVFYVMNTRHNVIEALLLKLTGYVSQHLQEPHEEGLARDVRTDQLWFSVTSSPAYLAHAYGLRIGTPYPRRSSLNTQVELHRT